jgi:hypothetical protein
MILTKMPSLDAYQGLQLDDSDGLWSWLLAHKTRHTAYAQAAALQGVNAQTYDFGATSMPDDTWFQRHATSHYALQQFMAPDQTVNLNVLTQYTWDNDDDFQTWMQMHTLIHQRLDEGFGIF